MNKYDNAEKKASKSERQEQHKAELEPIQDFHAEPNMTVSRFIDKVRHVGFQSVHLGKAVDIIKRMKQDNAKIFLTFTSNMGSSGMRGLFAQLFSLRFVDIAITTVGAIEEDIIKTKEKFYVGSFDANDLELRKQGINRIGNIFVKDTSYVKFEEIIQELLEDIYQEKKKLTPSQLVYEIGKRLQDESSFVYQAAKNNIPIYCPAITDGSLGYQLMLFKDKHPDFELDVIDDFKKLILESSPREKKGVIILGGGVAKHHALIANLINEGMDYAVYITTAREYSGSLSGATPREALSWGKLRSENAVTVIGEASILFPLIMTKVLNDLGFV